MVIKLGLSRNFPLRLVVFDPVKFQLDMGIFDKDRKEELKAKFEARLNETSDIQEKAQGLVGKFKEGAAKSKDLMKIAMSGEYPDVTPQRLFSAVLIAAASPIRHSRGQSLRVCLRVWTALRSHFVGQRLGRFWVAVA